MAMAVRQDAGYRSGSTFSTWEGYNSRYPWGSQLQWAWWSFWQEWWLHTADEAAERLPGAVYATSQHPEFQWSSHSSAWSSGWAALGGCQRLAAAKRSWPSKAMAWSPCVAGVSGCRAATLRPTAAEANARDGLRWIVPTRWLDLAGSVHRTAHRDDTEMWTCCLKCDLTSGGIRWDVETSPLCLLCFIEFLCGSFGRVRRRSRAGGWTSLFADCRWWPTWAHLCDLWSLWALCWWGVSVARSCCQVCRAGRVCATHIARSAQVATLRIESWGRVLETVALLLPSQRFSL